VSDLSLLSSLTESSVLHLLRERFFRRHIYSYSGSTLISINPFRPLPHLYSPETAKRYETTAAAAMAAAADPAAGLQRLQRHWTSCRHISFTWQTPPSATCAPTVAARAS